MNNLVKAIVDTGKFDTIEFQFLPGHQIEEHSVITWDKMNGDQFKVVKVSDDDWVTCTIVNKSIFKIDLKYFQFNTRFFTIYNSTGEYYDDNHMPDISTDGTSGRVDFIN